MNSPKEILESMAELNPNAIIINGFDKAIVGIGKSIANDAIVLLYDYEEIINILMTEDGYTRKEAINFYINNIYNGYSDANSPIIVVMHNNTKAR